MRFLCGFFISICTIASNGQTIFNPNTVSSTQNEYIGSHARDPLGNSYLNVFIKGNMPLLIYGKNYNLSPGNYVLRFDTSDSLTLIYNATNLGVVQALAADKFGNIFVASAIGSQSNFLYTKLDPSGTIQWQVQGHTGAVTTNQILIDDQANSYIAGTVAGSSFFGLQLVQFVCCPPKDFLLKFSPTGSLTWIRTSAISDRISSLDMIRFDKQGNIILGGVNEIYVSQTIDGCESPKSIITINVKEFSPDDIFISNVITPNGDLLNEEFFLKPFPNEVCIGEFKSIKIINRWGGLIFYEMDRNFRWGGEGVSGIYYYLIVFEKKVFNGFITVLN